MIKLAIIFVFGISPLLHSQNKADDVTGFFMNSKRDGILKIFEKGGKYFGKLVWMNIPDRYDYKNPDTTKHKERILGQIIMKDMVFNGKDTWEGGTVYNSATGKTYQCKITRDEKGNLNFRGFIGISLLGQTAYFVKVSFKE